MVTPLRQPANNSPALAKPQGGGSLAHLRDAIRRARTERGLTQQALAEKLGIRQRQISDLERSTIDPRLSTLQNVARALDLEVMLVPRPLLSTVEALLRAGTEETSRPLYALDETDDGDEGAAR